MAEQPCILGLSGYKAVLDCFAGAGGCCRCCAWRAGSARTLMGRGGKAGQASSSSSSSSSLETASHAVRSLVAPGPTALSGQRFIVIGGGPVGFAAALLLSNAGASVAVYEGRSAIPNDPEESYPIGLNPRALRCLERIDPALADRARDTGKIVDAWKIFGGTRMVAELRSGVVVGTSRGKVNVLLYEAAAAHPGIAIEFGHKLVDLDCRAKTLTFSVRSADAGRVRLPAARLVVPVGDGERVIAADGVHSAVRRAMERDCGGNGGGFSCSVTPWTNEFRVLFAAAGATAEGLDTADHYIFSGVYTATVDNGGQQQWTCVLGARDDAPAGERALLLSADGTPENVAALRAYLARKAPRCVGLFDDAELKRYFTRRSYRGAVIKSSRLHEGDWLALLGDAAHSVLPATGEGINSGLEDAMLLADACKPAAVAAAAAGMPPAFEAYSRGRCADVSALGDYALYLNSLPGWMPGEGASRVVFTILTGLCKSCQVISSDVHDNLFGPNAVACRPYVQIVSGKTWTRYDMMCLLALSCLQLRSLAGLSS
eukprot:SAG22_NODE_1337_length_4697_cov_2.318182_2_plen_544_part_00